MNYPIMTLSILAVLLQGQDTRPQDGQGPSDAPDSRPSYAIADTGQDRTYGEGQEIAFPKPGASWHGQDAQYRTHSPRYRNNRDGTISDLVTGLMWEKKPDGTKLDQNGAEKHATGLELAGHDDWRLPTIKELQSIVDYRRAPDATDARRRAPAIDPVFDLSQMESWFWSSTTHIENGGAYYVCFGQSFSTRMQGGKPINAHGAGAVRSDPKTGDPSRWAAGRGPQSDEVRILNLVRCVRGGGVVRVTAGPTPLSARDGNPFFQRFDSNADGKISREEFPGPERRFDRLDKNGDGSLQADEVPSARRRNQSAGQAGPARGRPARGGQGQAGRARAQGQGQAPRRRGSQRSTIQLGQGLEVGTGSPLYNPDRSRPCTMNSYGGKLILVDLGEGTTDQLDRNGIAMRQVAGVMFTHHHRDHNADAMSLLPRLWQMGSRATIVGPKGTQDLVGFLRRFYDEDLSYCTRKSGTHVPSLDQIPVQELPGKIPAILDGLTIRTALVPHTIQTFAYRFDAGDRSIVVSGDLSYSTALIELAAKADLLVIDSGGIAYEGEPARPSARKRGNQNRQGRTPAHAGMDEIARMAQQAQVGKLVLVHFRKGKVDEKTTRAAMGKIYKGKIIFAKDMQVIRYREPSLGDSRDRAG